MRTKHLVLFCAAAMLVACAKQTSEIEETPPPAAAYGDEMASEQDVAAVDQPPPAPDAPPPAAAPAEPPKPEPPTVGAVVVHRVKDYDAWKKAFDEHEGARAGAGVVGHGLSIDADKKNTVVVYLGSNDLGQLKGFLDSKDLKAAMKDAGVRGKPKITLMTHGESKPAEGEAAITLMITHRVKDYAAWKQGYDAHADKRKEAGVIGESISQDPDNPNLVHVYLQGSDTEKLRAFAKDKGLKKAMKEAGVKGKPIFLFMEPKEMRFYPPDSVAKAPPAEAPPAPDESGAPAVKPAPDAKE